MILKATTIQICLTVQKILGNFTEGKVAMFSFVFWADTLEYNGCYADLRGWAKGVGGCQSAALIGSYKQIRQISCYDLGVFLDREDQ